MCRRIIIVPLSSTDPYWLMAVDEYRPETVTAPLARYA